MSSSTSGPSATRRGARIRWSTWASGWQLLEAAADDGRTACVLLDVVCGHGAHADPASELAGAVARAARHAAVVVRVCGTDADPQDASRQAAALRDAGAVVAPSNAAAARLAARAIA